MVKVLFKSGDDYVDAHGKVATPEEVEAHLSNVEPGVDGLEIEPLSTAELVNVAELKAALENAQNELDSTKLELEIKKGIIATGTQANADQYQQIVKLDSEKLELQATVDSLGHRLEMATSQNANAIGLIEKLEGDNTALQVENAELKAALEKAQSELAAANSKKK